MNIWQTMEMVHSRSYTHIIKNVYADPSEVFDKILDDDNILQRAQSVTKAYDEFINAAQSMELVTGGNQTGKILPVLSGHSVISNANFTERLLMSTSLKGLDSMYRLLVLRLWRT